MSPIRILARARDGASAVEYTIVLAGVALIGLGAWSTLGRSVSTEVRCAANAVATGAPGSCGAAASNGSADRAAAARAALGGSSNDPGATATASARRESLAVSDRVASAVDGTAFAVEDGPGDSRWVVVPKEAELESGLPLSTFTRPDDMAWILEPDGTARSSARDLVERSLEGSDYDGWRMPPVDEFGRAADDTLALRPDGSVAVQIRPPLNVYWRVDHALRRWLHNSGEMYNPVAGLFWGVVLGIAYSAWHSPVWLWEVAQWAGGEVMDTIMLRRDLRSPLDAYWKVDHALRRWLHNANEMYNPVAGLFWCTVIGITYSAWHSPVWLGELAEWAGGEAMDAVGWAKDRATDAAGKAAHAVGSLFH